MFRVQGLVLSGSESGSYLTLIDSYITQLKAQGPSRTCNESADEEGLRVLKVTKRPTFGGSWQWSPARWGWGAYRGTSLIRNTHPPSITIGLLHGGGGALRKIVYNLEKPILVHNQRLEFQL